MKQHKISLSQLVITLGFLALTSAVYASEKTAEKEDNKNPLGCRDVGYQYELKILKLLPAEAGDRQSLYFIFNNLAKPVTLYQMRKEESSQSMYLNHLIQPHQWGVLSTSEKELKYICSVDDAKASYGKVVDCGESLRVCEYARVKYGMNNKGNFWMVGSTTKGGAVQQVLHYGIIPR